MSLDPIDKKRKTLSLVPQKKKAPKRDNGKGLLPSSSAKMKSQQNQQLIEKVKGIEIFREDRIKEAKIKIFSRAYESSKILDTLADELLKELK